MKTTYYVLPEVFNVELRAQDLIRDLSNPFVLKKDGLIRGKERVTSEEDDSLRWERNGSICLPIACWVMKIKMVIFVGNSGNTGTLLSFISICSHVPHERTLIWNKYEYANLLIFSGFKKLFPGSRSSHAKQPIEK